MWGGEEDTVEARDQAQHGRTNIPNCLPNSLSCLPNPWNEDFEAFGENVTHSKLHIDPTFGSAYFNENLVEYELGLRHWLNPEDLER